jgi:hypothetical protein
VTINPRLNPDKTLRSLLDVSDTPCNSEREIPLALPLQQASTTQLTDVLLLRPTDAVLVRP